MWMITLLVGCLLPTAPDCMGAEFGAEAGATDGEACDALGATYVGGPGRCEPGEVDDNGYADAYYAAYCEAHEAKLAEDGVGCGEDGDEACAWQPTMQ